MDFSVIGGDMRQAKLCELLAADGHTVSSFALDRFDFKGKARPCKTVKECVGDSGCVILPLPVAVRDGLLNAPLSQSHHTVAEVLSAIPKDVLILGGRVDEATRAEAAGLGLGVTDYFDREELAVKNAVATAEGALSVIMDETAVTVSGTRCLVIGFGRLGKVICHRLRGLGAEVSAAARSWADLAWIEAYGYSPVRMEFLSDALPRFDVIVNTVPALILDRDRLAGLKPGCLCLDLASKPGGTDFSEASRLGVHAIWALGLPGEAAPVSAGANIRDTVYNILRERGDLS